MKIVFIIKTLATRGGGAERVLTHIIGGLARRGHDVTLLSFGSPNDPDFYPVDATIRRYWLRSGNVQARSSTLEVLNRISGVRKLIRDLRPDIAVGFMHSAYVPLALALSTSRVPVIASEHILYDHYHSFPLEALALRVAAPLCARITVISDSIRNSFPPALRRRMDAIPNPVVGAGPLADPIGGQSKVLLNVGRLFDQKDQRTLIEAFARVAHAWPDWTLRIVGEGPLRRTLESLVRDKGLQGRVQLPGAVDHIGAEYAAAQLFVMSSRYESFGLATAEALAHGLPAIGFADCAGTNELIHDNVNGTLVPHGDRIAGLEAALRRLMTDSDARVRLGAAGPSTVKQFSLESIVSDWERLLCRCAKRGPTENIA